MDALLNNELFLQAIRLFGQVKWLDVTFTAVIFIGLIRGAQKGVAVTFAILLQMVFTVVVSLEYSGAAVRALPVGTELPAVLLQALSFLAFSLAAFLLSGLILKLAGRLVKCQFAKWAEKGIGALIGAGNMVLILAFVVHFTRLFPSAGVRKTYEKNSTMASDLGKLCSRIHKGLRGIIPADWRAVER